LAEPTEFELGGVTVAYTTVHIPEEQRPFDYAVAACFPEGQNGYEIAVSDDVPESIRGLWAWHEFNDFKTLGDQVYNRCIQSEKAVAELVNDPARYAQYLEHRIPFYQSLATFMMKDIGAKGAESEYDVMDVQACYAALDFLIDSL
jgi:hypothetical protein